jgi:hypothetical protein
VEDRQRPGSPVTGRLREVIQQRDAARGNSTYVFPGYGDGDEDAPRS